MAISSLIAPYGQQLVSLLVAPEDTVRLRAYAATLPRIRLSRRALCDLEMLTVGAFSPLDRFMGQNDMNAVLANLRLTNGLLFPLPVTLPVKHQESLRLDADVALVDDRNRVLAVMTLDEIYPWNRDETAHYALGTTDPRHPLVAEMAGWGPLNISGPLRVLQLPAHYDFTHLRHTPQETRALLASRHHRNVVAFQTRNPLHRAHEEMMKRAIDDTDGVLLLHPVTGMTRPGDVDHYTRVRAYQALTDNHFPADRVLLSLLPLAMWMAGPREALLHAIIRRNYGANHIIIGRDHAGPGLDSNGEPFYPPYAAQELVQHHESEIGVRVIPFRELVYLPDEERYEETTRIANGTRRWSISGTQVRTDYLAKGRPLPDWFTRPEVARILAEAHPAMHRTGFCIWLTGLSASGKSTIAEILEARLLEHGRRVTVLDGDVVRTHLSSELGFSKEHRDINIRRIGFVASEIVRHQGAVICAAISPYRATRAEVRALVGSGFIEVFVDTPLDVCERRDPKDLYARARRGEILHFTGISDPYEAPEAPEIHIHGGQEPPEACAQMIVDYLIAAGYIVS